MLVNVCMITYNHSKYIREAIESILNQVTDFNFQLIIGEDNSTDGSREICLEYAAAYPEKIQLIASSANIGMIHNFVRTYRACKGDYIAFCEGDDYWTETDKLQQQINFLVANPDYSGCFHNVVIRQYTREDITDHTLHQLLPKDTFTTEDILGPWFIPSPSFVFRNYRDFELPGWYFNCHYGDLPFMLLLSLRGPVKYLPQVMAVYRKHAQGMSEVHKAYDKIMVMTYIYTSFNIHTKFRYHPLVREAIIYEITRHMPPPEMKLVKLESRKRFSPMNFLRRLGYGLYKRLSPQ